MKFVFWIAFLGLVLAACLFRRNNERLQFEIDAYRELIHTSGSPPPEQPLPSESQIKKSGGQQDHQPVNHATLVGSALADKRHADLEKGLFAWAQSDSASALNWFFKEIGDPYRHSGLIDHLDAHLHGALLAGIASANPARALQLYGWENPRHPAAGALFRAAESFLEPTQFKRLMEEALKIKDQPTRLSALQIGIGTMTRAGRFDAAADLAVRASNLPPTERNQLIMTAANYDEDSSSDYNPGKVAEWLAEASDKEHTPQNMAFFVQRWAGSQFDQAAEWLNGLEQSEWRDHAVAGFVSQAKGADPETAKEWAATIADLKLREKVLAGLERP